jgi:putative transcriptional regulator
MSELKVKPKMHHFTDAGLKNVWLVNGFKEKDTPYGKGVSIQNVAGLTKAICRALTKKPQRLTGVEFRYLRLHLEMSQKSLAKYFGNSEQSVAIWEKTGRVPKWADHLIRVVWIAKNDGNTAIKHAVDRINDVDRLLNQRIVLHDTRSGWKSKIETEAVV